MTVADDLRKAKALLTPETWCQGKMARGRSGKGVTASGKYAVQWCMIGALYRVTNQEYRIQSAWHFLDQAVERVSRGRYDFVPEWQDTQWRTFDQVMKAYDKAIQLAEEAYDQ